MPNDRLCLDSKPCIKGCSDYENCLKSPILEEYGHIWEKGENDTFCLECLILKTDKLAKERCRPLV